MPRCITTGSGFWALSRHQDVREGFRNSTTLSNRDGVSLDPISGSARDQDDVVPRDGRSRPPAAAHIGVEGLHRRGASASWSHGSPNSRSSISKRCWTRRTRNRRLRRRIRGQAADGRHLRADGGPADRDRRSGPGRRRHAPRGRGHRRAQSAIEASDQPDGLLPAEMVAERRRSRPTTSPPRCSKPRSTATASPTTRSSAFLFLMVIAGNETTTKLLANAGFWGVAEPPTS